MWGLGQSTRGFAIVGHSRTPDSLKLIELPVDLKKTFTIYLYQNEKRHIYVAENYWGYIPNLPHRQALAK